MKNNNHQAFTLLELIISIAIVGIIASYAIPSYQQSILRSHRSDATTALLQIQIEQEKWRASHNSYANLVQLNIKKITENGFYKLSILKSPDAEQFFVLATPLGKQMKDSCGRFALNQFGPIYDQYASGNCWGE